MREATCWQNRVGASTVVAYAKWCVGSNQDFTSVFQRTKQGEWLLYLYFEMLRGIIIGKRYCLLHRFCQYNTARSLFGLKSCATKSLTWLRQGRHFLSQ
jgi:hypothetical protein